MPMRTEEENYAGEEKLKFEVKLEEAKLQMQAKIQHDNPGGHGALTITGEDTKGMSVTLPKMNIAQFDGSHMDYTVCKYKLRHLCSHCFSCHFELFRNPVSLLLDFHLYYLISSHLL